MILGTISSSELWAAVGVVVVPVLAGYGRIAYRLGSASRDLKEVKDDLVEVRADARTAADQTQRLRISVAVLQSQVSGRPYREPEGLGGLSDPPRGS